MPADGHRGPGCLARGVRARGSEQEDRRPGGLAGSGGGSALPIAGTDADAQRREDQPNVGRSSHTLMITLCGGLGLIGVVPGVRDKKVETGAIHRQYGWHLSVVYARHGALVGQLGKPNVCWI